MLIECSTHELGKLKQSIDPHQRCHTWPSTWSSNAKCIPTECGWMLSDAFCLSAPCLLSIRSSLCILAAERQKIGRDRAWNASISCLSSPFVWDTYTVMCLKLLGTIWKLVFYWSAFSSTYNLCWNELLSGFLSEIEISVSSLRTPLSSALPSVWLTPSVPVGNGSAALWVPISEHHCLFLWLVGSTSVRYWRDSEPVFEMVVV